VGEEEPNKISAGENVFVIKTPKGLYVRTRTGRIYAVNLGNQFNNSARLPMQPSIQQSSPSVYSATDSPSSLLDPWTRSNSLYNSVPYSRMPGVGSTLNNDPYSTSFSSQFSLGPSGSTPFSNTFGADVRNLDPMSFLNTSDDGNFASWNSSAASQGMSGGIMSDGGGNIGRPPNWFEEQRVYQNSSRGFPANAPPLDQLSSSYSDLPSDLLCIDTTTTDRTSSDISNPTLPALIVRDSTNDSDSLNSLTFDDYGSDRNIATTSSSGVDPVFGGYQSPLYNMHSDASATVTSSSLFCSAATATTAFDVERDFSDSAADFGDLSAMMNDNDY